MLKDYDAALVQTHEHAVIARSHGVRAAVLPHPHGDHRFIRPRPQLNQQLKGVGFIFGDGKNMLAKDVQRIICRACVRMNLTLYLIHSPSSGVLQSPRILKCDASRFSNVTFDGSVDLTASSSGAAPATRHAFTRGGAHAEGPVSSRTLCPEYIHSRKLEVWSSTCPHRRTTNGDAAADRVAGKSHFISDSDAKLKSMPPLRDATGQHRFFDSEATRKVLCLTALGIRNLTHLHVLSFLGRD